MLLIRLKDLHLRQCPPAAFPKTPNRHIIVLGQVTEQLVPFLEQFKHDPKKATFLGQPIDYVIFEEDEIVFVEVKSGNSRLTSKQRHIKKLVKNGKVRWEEIKIKPIKVIFNNTFISF